MNKEELVKKMNDELFNSEIVDKEFFILSMIKQNIEERNEDDEIIKALSQYEKPLHTAYEIFTSYINMEQVLDKEFWGKIHNLIFPNFMEQQIMLM